MYSSVGNLDNTPTLYSSVGNLDNTSTHVVKKTIQFDAPTMFSEKFQLKVFIPFFHPHHNGQ